MDRSLPASINDNRPVTREVPPVKTPDTSETNLKLVNEMLEEASNLKGTQLLDRTQQALGDAWQGARTVQNWKDPGDVLAAGTARTIEGGLKGIGAVASIPGIRHILEASDVPIQWVGDRGGEYLESQGIDPRFAHIAARGADLAIGGTLAKGGLKLAKKGAKKLGQYGDAFYGLASATGMGTGAHGATGLISKAKPTQSLAQLGRTEAGKAYKKLGRDWRASHPNLAGFTDSTKPFYDSAGNQVILRPAATKTDPFAVKMAYVADRKNAGLTRSASEWRMTPTDKQTWSKTLGKGFHDPKKLNLDQHHRHMVKGYDWGFDGLSRAEGQQLSKMLFEDGHALGRVNYNKLNLPKPVHDKLHAWMDGQLGLNGLNMKSLKGMDIQTRYKHLSVYLENIQPAMDEAVFELMRRYKAKEPLFIPGVSLADQFTDARSGLRIGKKTKPTQWSELRKRNIPIDVKLYGKSEWKVGDAKVTWYPNKNNPLKGRGQIDILDQASNTNPKGVKALIKDFNDAIKEFPSGTKVELNPMWKDAKRRSIYENYVFKNNPNIKPNPDDTLGWIYTAP